MTYMTPNFVHKTAFLKANKCHVLLIFFPETTPFPVLHSPVFQTPFWNEQNYKKQVKWAS